MSTRAELLRNAAGGAALLAFGGGLGRAGDALAAAAPPPVRMFRTRPDLRPPHVRILHAERTADGYLFLAPSSGPGQRGVLILDNTGDVVWFRPTTPHTAMNFRTAVYKGEPVLTWWEGKADRGLGRGDARDRRRVVPRDRAASPRAAAASPTCTSSCSRQRGTALVTSYEVRTTDLTASAARRAGR